MTKKLVSWDDVALTLPAVVDADLAATYVTGGIAGQGLTGTAQDNTLMGSGGLPNPQANTLTGLMVSTAAPNPSKFFLGAFASFLNVSGTVASTVGSPGGGSTQVYGVNLVGPGGIKMPQAIVGFEGIATAVGTSNITEMIGVESTVSLSDTSHADTVTSLFAAAPFAGSGTPTVTTAYSLRIQEPSLGTNQYSIWAVGRSTLIRGSHSTNALEIRYNSTLIQWASDGHLWTGYASDGVSSRITLDPQDGANPRVSLAMQGANNALTVLNFGTPVFNVAYDGSITVAQKAVTFGAADSGGTGYKMMRVPN